jgi:iron complex outermembrane recepter protein
MTRSTSPFCALFILFAAAVWFAVPTRAWAQDAEPLDAGADDAGLPGTYGDTDAPIYETVVKGRTPEDEGLSRERIARDEIRRSGAASTAAVLEREPSVNASTGRRGERIISVRGFDQRGVAVTLDGVPFAIPYDGQLDLGKLPVALVDHLSLVKGPSSIVNGPGGLGGTVNIVTRDPRSSPLAETSAELGELGAAKLDAFHALDRNGVGYALGAGLSEDDGYPLSASFEPARNEDGGTRDNSQRRFGYAGGKLVLSRPGSRHEIMAEPFVVSGDFGVPPSALDTFPRYWRFGVWRARLAQAAHTYSSKRVDLEEAVYAGAFDNRLDSYDDETFSSMDTPRAFSSWYHDRAYGGRLRGEARFGLPWDEELALRWWLGAEHDTHESKLDVDEPTEEYRRTLLTIVPELELPLPRRFTATASVQTDLELMDASGGAEPATPGVGPFASLRWDPATPLMLRVVWARRCRIPTLRERYSSAFGSSEPNPDLRPETAYHVGLDASFSPSRYLAFELSGFDAEVIDMIDRVALGGGVEQQTNIGRARLAGAEAAVDVSWKRYVGAKVGYAYLFARRLDEDPPDDALEYIPAHKVFAEITSSPVAWLALSTSAEIVGPQEFQDRQVLSWGELGAYALWNARIGATPTDNVEVWGRVTNILDASYQTEYGYPEAGRQFWVGMRLSLE